MHLKRLPFSFCLPILLILGGLITPGQISAQEIPITSRPAWVINYTPKIDWENSGKKISGPFYSLLLDKQVSIPQQEFYFQRAIKILTSEGIQEESDISIVYEPSFQKLYVHEVSVYRNGKKIDKLADHRIRTLHMETGRDRYLYDERVEAVINLRDIRMGDVIVYAFTRKGFNPVLNGHRSSTVDLNYSVPVLEIKNRLIKNKDRPLNMVYHGDSLNDGYSYSPERSEYIWNIDTVDAVLYDKNTPHWYDAYRELAYTDFSSWREVVQLISPLYQVDKQTLTQLKSELQEVIHEDSSLTVVQQAIRFVQDDVRYLGFESGINAYKPHPPLQVLNQRFGDCKDKSFLLCAILKAYDVDAYPLLVNTSLKEYVKEELPSFNAFDHCVVLVTLENEIFCIDPTTNYQGGEMSNMIFPDYGYGLVIKEGEQSLSKLPKSQLKGTRVYQEFTILNGTDSVEFTVKSVFRDAQADAKRSAFANSSLDEISQFYLEYYNKEYAGIRVRSPLKYEDDRDYLNEFTIIESYTLANPTVSSDKKSGAMDFDFYALDVDYYLSVSQSPARRMPYKVQHRSPYSCEIKLHFPKSPEGFIGKKSFNNKAYRYDYVAGISGKTVTIDHSYETFVDHIASEETEAFIQAHEEMRDYLYYTATFSEGGNLSFSINLKMWAIAFLLLLLGIIGSHKLNIAYDFPPVYALRKDQSLSTGLFLIGLFLLIRLIESLMGFLGNASYLNLTLWELLLSPKAPEHASLIKTLLSLEMVFNSLQIPFLVLLLIQFLRKRTTFPALAKTYLAVNAAFTLFLVATMTYAKGGSLDAMPGALISFVSIVMAFIAIPYLKNSNQVMQTFIYPRNKSSEI